MRADQPLGQNMIKQSTNIIDVANRRFSKNDDATNGQLENSNLDNPKRSQIVTGFNS